MSPKPVAFRVHRAGYYVYTDDEEIAQFWAFQCGGDYEGLYLVADRQINQMRLLETTLREVGYYIQSGARDSDNAVLAHLDSVLTSSPDRDQPPRPTDISCVKPPDPLY